MKPEHKEAVKKFVSEINGKKINPSALLKVNPIVAKILVARIMAMTLQQRETLKTIVTSQTADALKVLLPELKELIDKGVTNAG